MVCLLAHLHTGLWPEEHIFLILNTCHSAARVGGQSHWPGCPLWKGGPLSLKRGQALLTAGYMFISLSKLFL